MKAFGPFRLDTASHCLWRADERAPLTPKAFDVLRYLVEHADRLVTQDELLEALWPETYVNPEGIRKYILEVRRALGDRPGEASFIETIPKRGYQFVAPVMEERKAVASDAARTAGHIVGREAGLSALNGYLEQALAGRRQVVFVTGEAGIGKTTLVDLFQHEASRQPDVRIARGQCIEGFGGIEAYYPMLEAIGSLLQDAAGAAIVPTLRQRAPTWLMQFPALVTPEQREALQREILGSTRERMVREICEALEAITAQTALLVILEDLHWVDPSTLDLLSALARRREAAKLLIVGTYRPVDVVLSQSPLRALKQDLMVRRLCHEVVMESLEESDIAEYLSKVFGAASLPPGLPNLIHQNSGGNPLFMVAIVQEMANRGLILNATIEDVYPGIPETLQQMLEVQLELLSPEERRILQGGSIAGERFSVWAVAAMLETSPATIEDACDRLASRQQFIRSAGIHGGPDGTRSAHYEFRHALYRQALQRSLTGLNRSRLHLSLAERLMPVCTAGRPELASELAVHFEEGRDYERAGRYLIMAAENAAKRFSYRDSLQILRHALELTAALPHDTGAAAEVQIHLHIGDAHYALGEISDSAAAYEAAAARAARAGAKAARLESLVRLAAPSWYLDAERGNAVGRQAVELSEGLDDPLLAARTRLTAASLRLLYHAWSEADQGICAPAQEIVSRLSGSSSIENVFYLYVLALQGRHRDALRNAEALVCATTNPTTYVLGRGVMGMVFLSSGRFGEVLELVRTGIESAEKNGEDPWMYIFGDIWLRTLCGDFDGVRRMSRIEMRSDTEPHAVWIRTAFRISSGYAALHRGRFDEASRYFAEVLDVRTTPVFFLHWHWRLQAQIGRTETSLYAGDLDSANRHADALLEAALSTAEPNMHARAWEIKARVAGAGKDSRGAAECIANALEILERFDIPMSGWQVHRTASDLCAREGDHAAASIHLSRARDLIMRIADSFDAAEPLRASLLSARPIRRILEQAASVLAGAAL
jgi:DNA-binding winged helix-turn-helix (wHTH) protein/tetratricopeptide (TPR) repeat protein